jgi:hypothetical protein
VQRTLCRSAGTGWKVRMMLRYAAARRHII